jgi:quercetin dioxygenase-like cupin family protein
MKRIKTLALILTSTSLVLSTPAAATPGSGFAPSPIVNGHFGTLGVNTAGDKTGKWGLILKTLDETDIGADRLVVQPGGTSGWHAHPAPVFVTVTSGSIVWINGADPLCGSHTYSTGESFIEGPYVAHNVRNASMAAGAEFVAVVIKPAGFVGPAFRLDRPVPTNCNF